jgi:putative hemolysin
MVIRMQPIGGRTGLVLLVLLGICLMIPQAAAVRDPSAVYCLALGYDYQIRQTAAGQVGYCLLPGGNMVDAWEFLAGNEGKEYSYCSRQGYRQKTLSDSTSCIWSRDCLVCVLPDGREVEVTGLMNLSVAETTCGDGRCATAENAYTCPKDCPTGELDGYCDRAADGKCDPDCTGQAGDPDCAAGVDQRLIIGVVAVGAIIALLLAIVVIRRGKGV